MPIYIKSGALGGGTWVSPAPGNLKVKSGYAGGGSWLDPSMVYVKRGDLGGGYWQDSGYRGYPGIPSAPWVHAWDYNNVALAWNPPTSGAPVASYEVYQTDQAGNGISLQTAYSSPWWQFPVAQNSYYQFFVRSKGSTGLLSAFAGPLRVYIGIASTYYETTELGSRPWAISMDANGWQNNGPILFFPDNVVGQWMEFNVSATFSTTTLSPFNQREIRWYRNGVDMGVGSWGNPYHVTHTFPTQFSGGGGNGFRCFGSGWSAASNGGVRTQGTLTIGGVEFYYYQLGHWTAATPNGYW